VPFRSYSHQKSCPQAKPDKQDFFCHAFSSSSSSSESLSVLVLVMLSSLAGLSAEAATVFWLSLIFSPGAVASAAAGRGLLPEWSAFQIILRFKKGILQ